MATSAWRVSGTEGADDAVVKLKGLAAISQAVNRGQGPPPQRTQ